MPKPSPGVSRSSFIFTLVLLLLAGAALGGLSPEAAAQQRQVLQTNLTTPGIPPIGKLPASQQLSLAISLPLRNEEKLDALLQQLYDPSSPNYRHFLSVEQFTDQFGPTVVDYQRVIGFAQSHGLKVTHTYPNRLAVDVAGSVANIERTFQIRMNVYQHPTENRTFFAPDVEPTVEDGIPVLSVEGLSTYSLPHSMIKPISPSRRVHSNQTGSGPGGLFTGSDFRTAYGGGTTLDGSGQALGLIELGPYNLSEVVTYFENIGQPLNVPITNVLLGGADGICSLCNDGEETLDMEQEISIAPNASALIVYEAYTSSVTAYNAYLQVENDNLVKSVSLSFGWGGVPSQNSDYEVVFKAMAAQGQSSFVASGDAGANCGTGGYPGNSPNITDVGGTVLTTNGSGGAWQSESGWSGSGGGWNTQSPIPSGSSNFLWNQVPAINSTNLGNPNYRNIPDVAAEASDDYFCGYDSCGGTGGTSAAAPKWAGFVALINQQAATHATAGGSNSTVGLLNPAIYDTSADADFHDITSGSNYNSGSPAGCTSAEFSASTGYDLVTGWGTPNGPTLINALAPTSVGNSNFSMSATPSTLSLSPGTGGSSSIAVAALNGFNATTNLTVTIPGASSNNAPAGLTANLSAASIPAGGGPVTLTVSTTSSTPGGTYLVAITGTSGGLTQTAYVTVALPWFELVPSLAPGLTSTSEGTVPVAGLSITQGGTVTDTISVEPFNGFSGTVGLALSGTPPSGVTWSLSPDTASPNATSVLTETTSSTLPLTGANSPTTVLGATITGTSAGVPTQSTTINLNLFVNPPVSGGSGTPVDLSSAFNLYAFYDDANESTITATKSLDGVGYAYSANLLTTGVDFDGTQFNFGPANQPDAVYGTGSAIPLPGGYYTTLQMLATGIEGNQTSQTVLVTYNDNTTATFTQSFSDWCSALNSGCVSTGSNSGESVAVAMPYRDSAAGPDDRVFYLYHYSFALNENKTVQSVTLPNNRDVVVLALTLAGPLTTGFTLSSAPNALNVAQSGSNSTTVTVTPTGGFTNSVSLSASGLPGGVTAQFTPSSTASTSSLVLTASATATTGAATITITGTSGSLTETSTLNLNVTPPASYSLTVGAPSQGTISPGGSSQAAIAVGSANGYTGSVTLACSIAPVVTPAPTCSFGTTSPVTVTASGGTATLTFTAVGSSSALLKPAGTFYAVWLQIPGLMLIGVGFGSRGRKKLLGLLLLWVVLTGLLILPACGGGSSSGGGGGGSSGTPAGTYTITITGKDANGVTQTNTAPTVTVTVN
jgi:subtilase family serine protease